MSELCDRRIQVLHAYHDLRDAGEIGRSWLAAWISPPIARREVVNQEREEVAVARTDLRGFPFDLHAIGPLTTVLSSIADLDGSGAEARDLSAKIGGSNGPGTRTAVVLELFMPFVRGDRGWIGIRLDRDLLEIRTIRETGERNLGGVVGMRPSVLAGETCGLKRALHGPNILAGNCSVVDFELRGYEW